MGLRSPRFTMRCGFLKNAALRHHVTLGGAITGIRRIGLHAALNDVAPTRLKSRGFIGSSHGLASRVGPAAHGTRAALHHLVFARHVLAFLPLLILLALHLRRLARRSFRRLRARADRFPFRVGRRPGLLRALILRRPWIVPLLLYLNAATFLFGLLLCRGVLADRMSL